MHRGRGYGVEGECGCPEAKSRLQAYIDGELEESELTVISSHLERCFPCGDRAEFERHLRIVIRQHASEIAPADLLHKVRSRCLEDAEPTGRERGQSARG
jgi:anti-sigma factor (TIGR02949 family)